MAEPARSHAKCVRWAGSVADNPRGSAGFSLSELVVVLAIIGIMALTAVPWVLSGLPALKVTWGAREIQSALNRAKMLAISTRQNICVQVATGGYQFVQGGCAGLVWSGQGTDSAGTFRPSNGVQVTNAGTSPIFTPFGTASQIGTLTLTVPGANSQTVSVTAAGRITIP